MKQHYKAGHDDMGRTGKMSKGQDEQMTKKCSLVRQSYLRGKWLDKGRDIDKRL